MEIVVCKRLMCFFCEKRWWGCCEFEENAYICVCDLIKPLGFGQRNQTKDQVTFG
jgi:hypothetical protein